MFPKWLQLGLSLTKEASNLRVRYPSRPFCESEASRPHAKSFIFPDCLGKYFAAAPHHINLTGIYGEALGIQTDFARDWVHQQPGIDLKWTQVPNAHSPVPLYTAWHQPQTGFCQKLPEKVVFHSSQLKGTLGDKYLPHLITETVSKPTEKD